MDLSTLQTKRTAAWKELVRTKDMYEGIRITYEAFLKQYEDAKTEFERADYALAEVDGRLQRIEEAKSSKGTRNAKMARIDQAEEAKQYLGSLTANELANMLKEMNIVLPEVEEVPLPSEVGEIPEMED